MHSLKLNFLYAFQWHNFCQYKKHGIYAIINSIRIKETKMSKPQKYKNPAEEIWQILREVSKKQKENAEETDRRIKETDRRMKETDRRMKETDRRMKETDRRLKKAEELFTSQWGKLMETLVEGDLLKLLKQNNIRVVDTTMNMKGHHQDEDWEIDILAGNGEEIVLVEVKTTMRLQNVKDFLYKLNKFTTWKPKYKDDKIYGAVAYLKADQGSAQYAEKQGLFVIRATGSSSSIINKKNFKPKIFS